MVTNLYLLSLVHSETGSERLLYVRASTENLAKERALAIVNGRFSVTECVLVKEGSV